MSAPVPTLAAWLLRTFGSGHSIETLLGDLTEEYHQGRNRWWFWWQALAAIVVTFLAEQEQAMRQAFWYVLVPTLACAAITAALIPVYMPTRYQSQSVILVVPQRVPESVVRATVTTRIEDRLQSLTQQIMSRTRLERIIQDFNLYAAERKAGIMEDVVEQMRRDIQIQTVRENAFRISFRGENPRTVMRVTEQLASLFIEENVRDRQLLAEGTDQFLEAQIQDLRRQILAKETELQTLRLKAPGAPLSQADLLPYEVLQESYKALLIKKQDSKVAANLERRQIGEQFRLLDAARLPERAIGPSRSSVDMAGAGIGLGLGCIGIVVRRKKLLARPEAAAVNNTHDANAAGDTQA